MIKQEKFDSIKLILEAMSARGTSIPIIILEGIKLAENTEEIVLRLAAEGFVWKSGRMVRVDSNVIQLIPTSTDSKKKRVEDITEAVIKD